MATFADFTIGSKWVDPNDNEVGEVLAVVEWGEPTILMGWTHAEGERYAVAHPWCDGSELPLMTPYVPEPKFKPGDRVMRTTYGADVVHTVLTCWEARGESFFVTALNPKFVRDTEDYKVVE